MLGETISNYKILRKLAEGGMGEVYLAKDTKLGRKVALKFLLPQYTSDTEIVERFKREAKVTATLNHPNIVAVHDLEITHDGELALILKAVEGLPWTCLLRPKSDTEKKLAKSYDLEGHLRILLSVCNAVAFAHSKSIAHLDLKPDNIMVGYRP